MNIEIEIQSERLLCEFEDGTFMGAFIYIPGLKDYFDISESVSANTRLMNYIEEEYFSFDREAEQRMSYHDFSDEILPTVHQTTEEKE